jgi:Uma2 family endonuclease
MILGMVAATSRPGASALPEQRMLLTGVHWKEYVILREALDTPGLRMTYLEGELELMSPSKAHEKNKTLIARLIETYAFLARIPLNGYGSTTFRREALARGVEPDECWVVGRELRDEGDRPDIVLEVIETAPLLDKLAVYDGFGVPEVWLYERGTFAVYLRRKRSGYELAKRSALLAELDFARLASLVLMGDQRAALEELARGLHRPSGRRSVRRPGRKKRV